MKAEETIKSFLCIQIVKCCEEISMYSKSKLYCTSLNLPLLCVPDFKDMSMFFI